MTEDQAAARLAELMALRAMAWDQRSWEEFVLDVLRCHDDGLITESRAAELIGMKHDTYAHVRSAGWLPKPV